MMFVLLSRASASYRRVLEVLKTEVDLTDSQHAQNVTHIKGDVEFKNVCFKYDRSHEEYVLKNISFTAKAGQVVAIIGGTGAGKSSLVQLLPRLYDATEGQVLIDGRDVKEYTLHSLRDQVGMVLQKTPCFPAQSVTI